MSSLLNFRPVDLGLLRGLTLAAALVMIAPAASAEITAAGLLREWQDAARAAAQPLEIGSRSETASGVSLTDVATSIPVEGGKLRLVLPQVDLVETGDGMVEIVLPDPILATLRGADYLVAGRYLHDGLSLVAGGDDDTRTYRYSADTARFVLDTLLDSDGDETPLEMEVTLSGLASLYTATGGRLLSDYTIAALMMQISADEPGQGSLSISYGLNGIVGEGDGPSNALLRSADPAGLLREGADLTATLIHQGGGYTMMLDDPEMDFVFDGSSAGGALNVALSQGGVAYDVAGQDLRWRYSGSQVPFPVELAMDSFGIDVRQPLLADSAPQPFGLRLALGGLTASQSLWDLFDPSEVLPRTPGTAVLDLSGQAILMTDLLDLDPMQSEAPGEVTAITLNDLTLRVLGAELTGQGGFDLDMNAPGAMPGMPQAVGALDLRLDGANQLIDRLVQIGILQPQDVVGLRMFMGIAARPGEGPDSLLSTLQLTPDGQVIANGMRLR